MTYPSEDNPIYWKCVNFVLGRKPLPILSSPPTLLHVWLLNQPNMVIKHSKEVRFIQDIFHWSPIAFFGFFHCFPVLCSCPCYSSSPLKLHSGPIAPAEVPPISPTGLRDPTSVPIPSHPAIGPCGPGVLHTIRRYVRLLQVNRQYGCIIYRHLVLVSSESNCPILGDESRSALLSLKVTCFDLLPLIAIFRFEPFAQLYFTQIKYKFDSRLSSAGMHVRSSAQGPPLLILPTRFQVRLWEPCLSPLGQFFI